MYGMLSDVLAIDSISFKFVELGALLVFINTNSEMEVDGEGPVPVAAPSRCFPSHLESCPGLNSAA